MEEEILQKCLLEIQKEDNQIINTVSTSFAVLDTPKDVTPKYIEIVCNLIIEILKKYRISKNENSDYVQWLFRSFEEGKSKLRDICEQNEIIKQRNSAFKGLINLLPFYHGTVYNKPVFPNQEYGDILEIIISSQESTNSLIEILQKYMIYEDMRLNMWKAMDIATKVENLLTPTQVKNLLFIMDLVKPEVKKKAVEQPINYFCGVKIGLLNTKEMGKCIRNIWERIILVDLPLRTRQLLLIALLENMMPQMEKPIFLTDYFMNSLEYGGAVTLLSLQGIFELIQKHNINYPNIYGKLYSMFTPIVFETSHKARFYYLSDLFLSSLHLPEALVAGFAKRFARLAIVAPPADSVILMAFIMNLIIRHPGLNKLITNLSACHMNSDPYLAEENDPSATKALESSLWEILLLQNHAIPSVADAAMFINNPLPSIEKDISQLLEVDSEIIFTREIKKKMKEPPLTYDRPTLSYLSRPNIKQGFSVWDFTV